MRWIQHHRVRKAIPKRRKSGMSSPPRARGLQIFCQLTKQWPAEVLRRPYQRKPRIIRLIYLRMGAERAMAMSR